MTNGPRTGAIETFDCTRTECSEPPLPEPSAPAAEKGRRAPRGRTPLVIAGVALAFMAATGAGCATKTEAPVDTSSSPATHVETSPKTEVKLDPQKVESYAQSVEQYKNMDVETFDSLPQHERLLYAKFLLDDSVANGAYNARYGEGAKHHDMMVTPVKASLENTGKEIMDGNTFNEQLVFSQYADDSSFGVDKAKKVLSSVFNNVGDPSDKQLVGGYLYDMNMIEGETGPTTLTGTFTVLDTSELMTGKDENGETAQYIIVTARDEAYVIFYVRCVYRTFKSYDDSEQAFWLDDAATFDSTGGIAGLQGLGSIQ